MDYNQPCRWYILQVEKFGIVLERLSVYASEVLAFLFQALALNIATLDIHGISTPASWAVTPQRMKEILTQRTTNLKYLLRAY